MVNRHRTDRLGHDQIPRSAEPRLCSTRESSIPPLASRSDVPSAVAGLASSSVGSAASSGSLI